VLEQGKLLGKCLIKGKKENWGNDVTMLNTVRG